MRASPRTWPSIRLRRRRHDDLASLRMGLIYPLGVSAASGRAVMDQHSHSHGGPAATDRVIDPVCGMTVDPHTSPHRAEHQGRSYHFCSADCRSKFAADPQKYLAGKDKAPVPEGTIYTCPMHPQIRQVGPGSCPICGMALEPELASLDAPPNPELADMTRRFWVGLVLALPAVVLEMGGHLVGGHGWVDQTLSH